jgi:uncharacterized repeat protein (TIGR02543 family)
MRKINIISSLLAIVLLFSTTIVSAQFAGGDGSESSPWQISTSQQLDEVHNYRGSSHTDKYFELINDIDLTDYLADGGNGYTQWGVNGWLPIGYWTSAFCGHFDGNNYSIAGLYINRSSDNRVGLFGVLDYGTIKNVNLINVDITGDENVGGIVGYMLWNETVSVENSSVTGLVSGRLYIGGIAGFISSSSASIINCYTDGTINAISNYAGGIAGKNAGTITNSYSSGNTNGDRSVAGIAGYNEGGTILYSYSTGTATGTGSVGGIAGYSWQGRIEYTFSSGDISSSSMNCGGIAGDAYGGIIDNSYALGNVTAPTSINGQNIGGVLGATNDTTILNKSYAVGNVTGLSSRTAGIAGVNQTDATVEDSYWNTETSTQSNAVAYNIGTVSNLVGLTSAQMQGANASTNMNALDFSSVWETVESTHSDATANGYPILQGISRIAQLEVQQLLVTYNLTLSETPSGSGTSNGQGQYGATEEIVITATPAEGYEFVNWTGDTDDVDDVDAATTTVTMPSIDVSITANFSMIEYQLTIVADPVEGGTISGDGAYNFEDNASITATPAEGYEFVGWSGDAGYIDDVTLASATVTMPSDDVSITANFSMIEYQLALIADPVGGGTISGDGAYNFEDEASITATPAEGYEFVGWSGDTEYIDDALLASATVTMPSDGVSFTANFSQIEYQLALVADPVEGGTIAGDGAYNFEDEANITATPAEGYEFVGWTGDTEYIDDALLASATVTMPSDGVSFTANFALIDYQLTITANPAEGGTFTGNGTYNFTDVANITATPATGYEFVNWTGDTENIDDANSATATITMPADDVSLTANFALIDYQLTITASPAAGGTYTGNGTYNMSDVANITATPAEGYEFINWTGDTENIDNANSATATITMPADDVSLTANFALIDYQLTITASPAEGGTFSGEGTYNFGDDANITATPTEDYEFVNWTGDTEYIDNANSATATVTMPSKDISLTANFEVTTGMEIITINEVRIYPNPLSNGILNVQSDLEISKISIVNALGVTVLCSQSNNIKNIQLDLSNLPKGMYFVKIEIDTISETKKLIIK